ncbi:Hypothetical predicted protein [Olea europaea subsp. europaea]|uniref:Uncharacterized protein n=1 Tax=Olea europaea subsp. europaea TaxID=158383 RepID=A0A8S0V8W4_OLEEU|nr:Hypothetical predicted protein [Olea europaea subsp. europaea]
MILLSMNYAVTLYMKANASLTLQSCRCMIFVENCKIDVLCKALSQVNLSTALVQLLSKQQRPTAVFNYQQLPRFIRTALAREFLLTPAEPVEQSQDCK